MFELITETDNNDKTHIETRLNALLPDNKVEIIEIVSFFYRSGSVPPRKAVLVNIEPLSKGQTNTIAEFSLIFDFDPEKFMTDLNNHVKSGFGWKLLKCSQSCLMALFGRDINGKIKEEAHKRGIENAKEMEQIMAEERAQIKDQVNQIQTFLTQTMVEINKQIEDAINKGNLSEIIRLRFLIVEKLAKFGVFIEFRHIESENPITEYLGELSKSWNVNLELYAIAKWKKIRNKIVHDFLKISDNEEHEGTVLLERVTKLLIGKINEFLKAPYEWKPKENPFSDEEGEDDDEEDDEIDQDEYTKQMIEDIQKEIKQRKKMLKNITDPKKQKPIIDQIRKNEKEIEELKKHGFQSSFDDDD